MSVVTVANIVGPPTSAIADVSAGTGLTGGGSSGTVALDLADTAVTPGDYTSANISVDQQGRITAAANGSGGGGGASTDLSNLTSPTAINQDLNMATGLQLTGGGLPIAKESSGHVILGLPFDGGTEDAHIDVTRSGSGPSSVITMIAGGTNQGLISMFADRLELNGQGTGFSSPGAMQIRWFDGDENNTVSMTAPDTLTETHSMILPKAHGATGNPVITDGNNPAQLSFADQLDLSTSGTILLKTGATVVPEANTINLGNTTNPFGLAYVAQIVSPAGNQPAVQLISRQLIASDGSTAQVDWNTTGTTLLKSQLGSNQASPPTFTINAAAGTGASVTDISTGGTSTDTAGKIRLVVGTGATTGSYVTVTFSQAFTNDTVVLFSPANSAAAGITTDFYVTSTTTTFDLSTASGEGAGTYDFNYHVIGIQ